MEKEILKKILYEVRWFTDYYIDNPDTEFIKLDDLVEDIYLVVTNGIKDIKEAEKQDIIKKIKEEILKSEYIKLK